MTKSNPYYNFSLGQSINPFTRAKATEVTDELKAIEEGFSLLSADVANPTVVLDFGTNALSASPVIDFGMNAAEDADIIDFGD